MLVNEHVIQLVYLEDQFNLKRLDRSENYQNIFI